jgi:hypothetical protein
MFTKLSGGEGERAKPSGHGKTSKERWIRCLNMPTMS